MAGILEIKEKILTDFIVSYLPPEFTPIADKVATKIPVKEWSGKYLIWPHYIPELLNTEVALDQAAVEFKMEFKGYSEGTYAIEKHRASIFIGKDEVEAFGDATEVAAEKAAMMKTNLLLEKEVKLVNILKNTSNVKNVSPKWNSEGPTIERDIKEAIEEFKENAKVAPNTIIIPEKVWNVMSMDPTFRDIWKYFAPIKELDFATLFNKVFKIEKVFIVSGEYRDAKKNAPAKKLWDDDVYLLYTVERGSTRRFTAIGKFVKKELGAPERIKVEDPVGEKLIFEEQYQIKEICPNAILKIADVLG